MINHRSRLNLFSTILFFLLSYVAYISKLPQAFFVLFGILFGILMIARPIRIEKEPEVEISLVSQMRERDIIRLEEMRQLEKKIYEIDRTHQTRFSYLLEKKVRLCCHQTARIGERYCICGRALEYPNLTETIINST